MSQKITELQASTSPIAPEKAETPPKITVTSVPGPPIMPESAVDLAWGLSFYFSRDDQEKKFGEDLKNNWEKLSATHKKAPEDTQFLNNLDAVIAGTIYDLAQLRQQAADQFKFLDALQTRRLNGLEGLVNLSKDARSVAARLAGVSIGSGVSFLQYAAAAIGPAQFAVILIGGGIAYLASEFVLRVYGWKTGQRIMSEIQERKKTFLRDQYKPQSSEMLHDLLIKINRLSNDIYKTKLETDKEKAVKLYASFVPTHSLSFVTGSQLPRKIP